MSELKMKKKQTPKINITKLIDEVTKYPQIYNPDHDDFNDTKITLAIFNTSISEKMGGIRGDLLHRKWNKILYKYASFIKKLSNDDSSESTLEKFMEWPWTRSMRVFKPYVRKQFNIPKFEPSQLLDVEFDHDSFEPRQFMHIPTLPDMLMAAGTVAAGSMAAGSMAAGPMAAGPMADGSVSDEPVAAGSRAAGPVAARPMAERPRVLPTSGSGTRPEFLLHNMPDITTDRPEFPPQGAVPESGLVSPNFVLDLSPTHQRMQLPAYIENLIISTLNNTLQMSNDQLDLRIFQNIAALMGLRHRINRNGVFIGMNRDTDTGTDTDTDLYSSDTEEEIEAGDFTDEAGPSSRPIKPSARARRANVPNKSTKRNAETDDEVLPDIPKPKTQKFERGPAEFTAQEHIFLAWAKTLSTFTAKRQATIKMKINKIMSEAEFEDLDDEFFAANSPVHRSIYTSPR